MERMTARTVPTRSRAKWDSAHHFSFGARTTSAFSYHKCATETTIVEIIPTRGTVNLPLAPAIIIPVQSAVAAFLASGFVTATMIVETRATSHQQSAAITPVMLTRGSSVTRHASVFLSCGSVMETLIVTTDQTSPKTFAKVNKFRVFGLYKILSVLGLSTLISHKIAYICFRKFSKQFLNITKNFLNILKIL